jgi:hypothetical protein
MEKRSMRIEKPQEGLVLTLIKHIGSAQVKRKEKEEIQAQEQSKGSEVANPSRLHFATWVKSHTQVDSSCDLRA